MMPFCHTGAEFFIDDFSFMRMLLKLSLLSLVEERKGEVSRSMSIECAADAPLSGVYASFRWRRDVSYWEWLVPAISCGSSNRAVRSVVYPRQRYEPHFGDV